MQAEKPTGPKFVLVNPFMNLAEGFGRYQKLLEAMPPIGVAYLAAVLRKARVPVMAMDLFAGKLPPGEATRRILDAEPDVVGLSCLTPAADYALELSRLLKIAAPRIKIVLGNLHALFADEILADGNVDVVCRGEGEETILDLVAWARGEKPLSDIPGISYRNGAAVHNAPRPFIEDLDALPFPDWDGLPYRDYGLLPFATIARPALTIAASRGCRYRCTFCSLKYLGRKVRLRSNASVLEELKHLSEKYGVRQAAFVDAYFPVTEKHGLEFCADVQRAGIEKMPVLLSQMRVDTVTRGLAREMKRAGWRRVMFGIESGSQEVLDGVGKQFTVAQAENAVRTARAEGLETVGFFIFGLPGDDLERARATMRLSRRIPLDFAKFSMFVPFPGSELYERLVEEKVLAHNDWRRFTTFNPTPEELPYVARGLTARRLADLQHRATLAFYLRPGVVLNLLVRVRTVPFRMLLAGAGALVRSLFGLFRNPLKTPV